MTRPQKRTKHVINLKEWNILRCQYQVRSVPFCDVYLIFERRALEKRQHEEVGSDIGIREWFYWGHGVPVECVNKFLCAFSSHIRILVEVLDCFTLALQAM